MEEGLAPGIAAEVAEGEDRGEPLRDGLRRIQQPLAQGQEIQGRISPLLAQGQVSTGGDLAGEEYDSEVVHEALPTSSMPPPSHLTGPDFSAGARHPQLPPPVNAAPNPAAVERRTAAPGCGCFLLR